MSLFIEDRQRTLFPIADEHYWIWTSYKTLESLLWTADDVRSLIEDKHQYDTVLSDPEKQLLNGVIGLFVVADEIVLKNISANIDNKVGIRVAKYFYTVQKAQEQVHSEAYSKQADAIIPEHLKKQIFDAIETMPSIGAATEWADRWMDEDKLDQERMIAFAAFEGVLFSGAFAAIQWFKERNLLDGLTTYNELICRDENMHATFACDLLKSGLTGELPPIERIHEIIRGCVDVSNGFVNEVVPEGLIGLNSTSLRQYMEMTADNLCIKMGVTKIYNVDNPFPWMVKLFLNGICRNDFFVRRTTQYQTGEMDEWKDPTPI
jgi:ribonucleotide reductase beta subunit family protein with ferritin-like domain